VTSPTSESLPALPTLFHPTCLQCGCYRNSRAVCVAGEGSRDAQIVLLGEALGEAEEESHRPFQGRAGWLLDRCIREAGLIRSDLFVTNSARCRPKNEIGGNRTPTHEELTYCRTFLDQELAQLPRRKVIVALGASAGWTCLEPDAVPTGGVQENQGRVIWSKRYQSWVVQTIHPAFALRKPGEAFWLTQDLQKAQRIVETGEPPKQRKAEYRVVRTLDDAREMRAALLAAPYLVWDWETMPTPRPKEQPPSSALHLTEARGFCVSFCGAPHFGWVVPRYGAMATPLWSRADLRALDDILREVFRSNVPKIGHHVAFDMAITLSTLRTRVERVVGDTMIQHHLLNNHLSETAHGLKRMADVYTDYGRYDDKLDAWLVKQGYTRQGKPDGGFLWHAPNEMIWEYNATDSIVPWLIHPMLAKKLRAAGLWEVYTDERIPLVLEYAEMDRHGVPLDRERLEDLSGDLGTAMEAVQTEIGRHARVWRCRVHGKVVKAEHETPPIIEAPVAPGEKRKKPKDPPLRAPQFTRCCPQAQPVPEKQQEAGALDGLPLNPNSPDQVRAYLYDHRGLVITDRTETGQPSTKEEVLLKYAEVEPMVPFILHYRAYSKLKGTYVDGGEGKGGILQALDPDGYARMSTLLHVVETFRMATRKPMPVHLIPRPLVVWTCPVHGKYQFRDDECCGQGYKESLNIRGVVRPPEGYVLLAADHVQQEYALAAIASGQADLEEAMLDRREDAHEYVMGVLSGRSRREFQTLDAAGQWVWASKQAADEYKNLRSFFKQVNFMILYRGGADHLARSLNIELGEAERHIYEYYERLQHIKWWQYQLIMKLRETGRVTGLFKTYRVLPNIFSLWRGDRNEAERQGCNFPFQNGGYHVIARAIIRLAHRWRKQRFPGRILFSVHDEVLSMVRRDLVEEGAAAMREEMERPHKELVGGCGIERGILADVKAMEEWGGEEWHPGQAAA
jgi:uracil-DNA glycosylase family 4